MGANTVKIPAVQFYTSLLKSKSSCDQWDLHPGSGMLFRFVFKSSRTLLRLDNNFERDGTAVEKCGKEKKVLGTQFQSVSPEKRPLLPGKVT